MTLFGAFHSGFWSIFGARITISNLVHESHSKTRGATMAHKHGQTRQPKLSFHHDNDTTACSSLLFHCRPIQNEAEEEELNFEKREPGFWRENVRTEQSAMTSTFSMIITRKSMGMALWKARGLSMP